MRHPRPWAATALAVLLVFASAGPASADPPSGVTPARTDIVGESGDTIGPLLDQLAHDYDATKPAPPTPFYSFDQTNPDTGATGDTILTKGCSGNGRDSCTQSCQEARPLGSMNFMQGGYFFDKQSDGSPYFCVDFAGSSQPRPIDSTYPGCGNGGFCFVSMAGDAVTWATRDAASGGSNAPASLTVPDLVKIFECKYTDWDQVGGNDALIQPYLPSTASGVTSVFLTTLGGGASPITPGACVSFSNAPLDNEGVNPELNNPDAIVPYSVGDYIAQVYHSAACLNASCTEDGGEICKAVTGKNQFGCDVHGVLGLGEITVGKTPSAPATPWPLEPDSKNPTINPKFDPLFQRTLYDIVNYDPNTTDHIPGNESGAPGGLDLEQIFASNGWICTSTKGQADIRAYGFLPTWRLSTCGAVS